MPLYLHESGVACFTQSAFVASVCAQPVIEYSNYATAEDASRRGHGHKHEGLDNRGGSTSEFRSCQGNPCTPMRFPRLCTRLHSPGRYAHQNFSVGFVPHPITHMLDPNAAFKSAGSVAWIDSCLHNSDLHNLSRAPYHLGARALSAIAS